MSKSAKNGKSSAEFLEKEGQELTKDLYIGKKKIGREIREDDLQKKLGKKAVSQLSRGLIEICLEQYYKSLSRHIEILKAIDELPPEGQFKKELEWLGDPSKYNECSGICKSMIYSAMEEAQRVSQKYIKEAIDKLSEKANDKDDSQSTGDNKDS